MRPALLLLTAAPAGVVIRRVLEVAFVVIGTLGAWLVFIP